METMRLSTRQRILRLLEADPHLGAAALARKVGVSRQRVQQILVGVGWRRECVWVCPPERP
jgi:predicted ArsR family transcriptional regulator